MVKNFIFIFFLNFWHILDTYQVYAKKYWLSSFFYKTIISIYLKATHTKLEKVENFFKEQLEKSEIAHADETETKINDFNHWIHSFSNDKLAVLTSNKNRGKYRT